jgi:hypothetical protein
MMKRMVGLLGRATNEGSGDRQGPDLFFAASDQGVPGRVDREHPGYGPLTVV